MTSFGQYPLVYQLRQQGDGSFIPVGLAEVSSFPSLSAVSLVVSSISATNYQGLDLGSLNFTGVQTITVTGQGSSILITTDPVNPVIRGFVFNTGGFIDTPSVAPGDPNVTVTYGPNPLSYAYGGTNNNAAPIGETVAYWNAGLQLETNSEFTFDGTNLNIPTGGVYKAGGSQITLNDIASITSPGTLASIPAPTIPSTYLIYNGTGITWSAVTGTGGTGTTISLPTTPGRVLISNDSTSVTSDPQLTYTPGTDTLNTYNINNVCDVCAIKFYEDGQQLSVKYLDRASTGIFETTSYSRANFATIASLNSYVLTSTYTQFTGTLKELAYKDRIDLQTTSVTGTLQVFNGGLGLTSVDQNKILVGGAANTFSQIVAPGAGVPNYLKWNGTAFVWESPTGTVTLPTDPCAVVFMNNTGTGLASNTGIRVNTTSPCAVLEILSNAADGNGGLDLAPDVSDEGFVRWNHDYDTLAIAGVGGTSVSLGVDDIIPVINKTGQQIKKGQVAWVSGADSAGLRGEISLLSTSNQDPFVLGVALHNINNTATGYLIKKGLIKNVTDSDVIIAGDIPSISVGDYLYVSPTAGKMTRTPPSAGVHAATIALVLDVNGTNISYGVSIEKGYDLGDLHDVNATPTNDGETLVWNTGGYYTTGTINQITGTLAVTKGGTGLTALTSDSFLVGNGTSPVSLILTSVFETTGHATQTYLTKNQFGSFTSVDLGELAFTDSVNVTTTSVVGTLPVTKGGTGLTTLTEGNFLVGNGTAIILQPTSTFETTGYSRSNFANIASLNSYVLTSTYNSFTGTLKELAYKDRIDLQTTSVTGTLPIENGGTSKTSFNPNELIYGSFLQNSNLTYQSNILRSPTVCATMVCAVTVCGTTLVEGGQPLTSKYYDRASTGVFALTASLGELAYSNQVNVTTTSVIGTLPVTKGGTGLTTLTEGNFLVGNGTAILLQPTSTFETTGYSRSTFATIASLGSYVLTSTYNSFTGTLNLSSSLKDVEITSVASNQVLKWNSTLSKWTPGNDNTGAGSTPPGGSDTQVQFNNENSFAGSPGLTFDLNTSTLRAQYYSNLPSASPIWNANQLSGYPIVSSVAVTGGPTQGDILTFYAADAFGNGNPAGWYYDIPVATPPGGSNAQIQFNNVGSFSGSPALVWNNSTSGLSVTGSIRATTYINLPVSALSGLSDTLIVSPALSSVLKWNGTKWVAATDQTGTGSTPAVGTQAGAIQFTDGNGNFDANDAFYYEAKNLYIHPGAAGQLNTDIVSTQDLQTVQMSIDTVTLASPAAGALLVNSSLRSPTVSAITYLGLPSGVATWNADKLEGVAIANMAPTATQHLGYDGTNWKPHWNSYSSITATSVTLPATCSNKLFISDTSNTYIQLPDPAECPGKQLNIIKSGASGYPIQVSSPYLDTATSTITINIPRDSIELISDGSSWFVNNVRQVYGHGRTIYLDDFITGSNETGEIGQYGWSFLNGAVTHLNTTGTNIDGTGRGIIHRATGATINQVASFFPNLQGTNTIFNMKDVLEFRTRLCLSSTLNIICRVGIMDGAAASGSPVRGIYFETSSGPNWFATTRNNNTETRTDTLVALNSNTAFQTLRFFRREDGGIEFYINNNLVASHTTNVPSDPTWGLPALVLVPTTASARAISIDYIGFCIVDYEKNRYL